MLLASGLAGQGVENDLADLPMQIAVTCDQRHVIIEIGDFQPSGSVT
ncbi:hypothetical protein [Asaia platycodi]